MKKHRSILSVGSAGAEIKIYTLRHPNGYLSHQCAWREMGRRQTKCFAKLPAAKLFAQQKTVALANGLGDLSTASMRDIEILKSCEKLAERFNTNLVSAMEEWASAREMIPEASLGVAARFYAEHHAGIKLISVEEAAELFVRAKAGAGCSEIYLREIRTQMKRLCGSFGCRQVGEISTRELDDFLRALKVGASSKNSIRKRVVTLFGWCRDQGYLKAENPTAAEKTGAFAETDKAPEIFTPGEMRKLLSACGADLLPALAVGAFTGIRTAEIGRLDWEDVQWERGFIEVKAKKAKTRARRLVPISNNLAEWLKPYRGKTGRITPDSTSEVLPNIAPKAGVKWKKNALRHSYASYRLAEIQDAAKVSLEMGNSPAMLFKHYRELVAPESAKGWFSIFPPENWKPEPIKKRFSGKAFARREVDTRIIA